MLTNLSFAAQASLLHFKSMIISLIFHPMVLGFGFGFLAATGIYIFLLAEEPRNIPVMLKDDVNASFTKIATRDEHGTYTSSYTNFQKTTSKIKILVYGSLLAFLTLTAISLLIR